MLGLGLVTVLALVLRVIGIATLGDLDFDEQASYFIASMAPGDMLTYLAGAPFEHPPLFYLVFHLWLGALGGTETAMRLFPALVGTLTVPIVGVVVARAAGTRAAVVAALLLAIMPLHVFHSRDARMYPMLGLLMVLALGGLIVGTGPNRNGSRFGIALALLAGAAALATHYYALFGVLGLVIGLWRARLLEPSRRVVVATGLAAATAICGGLAWLLSSPGLRTSLTVVRPRPVPLPDAVQEVAQSLGAAFSGPLAPKDWFIVSGAVAMLLLSLYRRGSPTPAQSESGRAAPRGLNLGRDDSSLGLLAFWGFVLPTLAVPLLVFVGRPFAPRFVALALPMLAVLAGLASVHLSRRMLLATTGGIAAVVLVGLVPMYTGYVRSDYGAAMVALRAEAGADDAIVLNGPWQDLLYRRYGWGLPPRSIITSTVPLQPPEAIGWLERLTAAHPRLWVVDAATDAADPDGVVAHWLDEHAYPRPVIPYQKALLRPYLTAGPGAPPLDAHPVRATALDVQLDTVALERWDLARGSESRLEVRGRMGPHSPARRMLARLIQSDGSSIWHWDGALFADEDGVRYRAAIRIPPDADPGRYRLEGLVYEPGADGAPRQISEPVPLGEVVVTPR